MYTIIELLMRMKVFLFNKLPIRWFIPLPLTHNALQIIESQKDMSHKLGVPEQCERKSQGQKGGFSSVVTA